MPSINLYLGTITMETKTCVGSLLFEESCLAHVPFQGKLLITKSILETCQ